ncbi:coiled-coil domain-containing protein 102B [Octodon degus]|uniref:Coiled-coil domain-containing protein 102B n=1 Tax=Octodon degus TaxID=10160 RepID=A0A6P6F416_OCTDE|nr:coiled-coil domain-containing protein 102B [Octodon degus]
MQQSSMKPDCDQMVPTFFPRESVYSCFPHHGPQCHTSHSYSAHSFSTDSWDICKELQLWELEEAKARAAQMEKTMRWWSECTANWREKWSKVRAERNSAREEGRQLRIRLEMTMKELNALKRKQSLSLQKEASKLDTTQDLELSAVVDMSSNNMSSNNKAEFQTTSPMYEFTGECLVERQFPVEEKTNSKGIGPGNCDMVSGFRLQAINLPLKEKGTKISTLQIHLNEFQQTLWKEREKLFRCTQFDILHGIHENEMEQIIGDIKEESNSQNNNDGIIYELRSELERLQAENTSGWDNIKLLETEKQELESENRRLKVQLKEMEELLGRQNRLSTNIQDPDFKASQVEPQDKSKAWCSWKHLFSYCLLSSDA